MTDQSIPEVLRGNATVFTGSSPAAPPGHVIAMSDVGSKVYLIRRGEVVGRVERRAGVSYMYLGSGTTGGLYRGAHGDTTAALALIAEAAERGRVAAGAASAGPAPEPEPSWLPALRCGLRDTVSQAVYGSDFDLPTHLTRVVDAVTAHAAAYLRPLHAELAEAKRGLEAVQGSLRARDARIAEQDEEIDAVTAEIARSARKIVRQAAEIDALRKWIAKQAGANAWAKATAEAYLGEEGAPSPATREVPAGEWRDGDTITGVWHQRAGRDGTGGLPFAESRMGGPTEVMATRPVPSLPTAQHAVIRCIAMRGTTVRDAREIVAELRYDCWYGTDRYTYRPQDIVRVIAVLSPGDEIPAPPIRRETVESLPTLPGSVGTATVQGRKGVRVMLAPRSDNDRSPWSSATRVASRFFHAAEEIADYVPELDGQEG